MNRPLSIPPLKDRIYAATEIDQETGCWNWQNLRTKDGYGQISFNMVRLLAHRASYVVFSGPIPDGYQIDHLCRNPGCVNPDHLEAVTPRVNTLRSNCLSALNARKTHCLRGHPLSGENLSISVSGARVCKTCRSARQRRRTLEKRAERLKSASPADMGGGK